MIQPRQFDLFSSIRRRLRVACAASLGLVLVIGLSACGGSTGFEPVITGVKTQSMMYGHTASILLGGKHLRSSLTVDTQGACTAPIFSASSTTEMLVLNCRAEAAGDFLLTVKSEQGALLYSETISIPKPQVMLFTAKGN